MSTNQPDAIPVGKPIPSAQKPPQAPVPPISEADANRLKKLSFVYMPKQLNTISAQKQILEMLAAVISPVRVCLEKAYRETFPKAESGEMPINQAVAQCAYEVNTVSGLIVLENLPLQQEIREESIEKVPEADATLDERPRMAGEMLDIDMDAPWPQSIEALRPLFALSVPMENPPDDEYIYIAAAMPPESGYAYCAVGIQAQAGLPVSVRYGLPSVWTDQPPAGLEEHTWVGNQNHGWWMYQLNL